MAAPSTVKLALYPETGAGGFSHVDGTIEFYTRINALIEPSMTVVDFGAGRGAGILEDPVAYRRQLRNLKGRVARVIGIDIDLVVHSNPTLDQAFLIKPGMPTPLADQSVDLIICDATFEHVAEPDAIANDFARIVKPGGWVCARTPNRWGYIALGARLVPERFHKRVLSRLQPHRKHEDIFPTHYRLNTWRSLREHFPPNLWSSFIYTFNAEPAYFGSSALAWRAMMLIFRLTPRRYGATFMIFLRRK